MVDVGDIPDFPGLPGQRPTPGAAPDVAPIPIVLVSAPLDRDYRNIALNAAAVDSYIADEIAADRAYVGSVERWSPWAPLQLQLGYAAAAGYNYGRFEVGGRFWYAFLSAEYLNLTDTRFTVDPDEWTTYQPAIGYSMIERGHVAVAASLADEYGDKYLTAPEPIAAEPVRGVMAADILSSAPGDWTVVVVSANDLRGNGTSKPFWERHIKADEIQGAAGLASSATVTSDAVVQFDIPDAHYPWDANASGDGTTGTLVDTISPGHTVTNPGHTFASGWAWHVANAAGHGGVDLNYNFQTFTAPGAGTVDHFNVAGVGMIVRLTLDTPAIRVQPQEPSGYDAYGPIVAIWFEHCSAAVDGHHEQGEVIGTSGDGGGLYAPHLHVHGLTDHGNVAGTTNRAQFFSFVGGSATVGPDVYVPSVIESPVSTIDGVAAGGGVYLFTPEGFAEYMTIMQGAPWTISGIVDVRLVPSWSVPGARDQAFDFRRPSRNPGDAMFVEAATIPAFVGELTTSTTTTTVLSGWRDLVLVNEGAGIYRKLITAPFTDILLGNGDTMQVFRPDQWHANDLSFQAVTGAAHGEPSIRLIPFGYNFLGEQMGLDSPVGGTGGLTHSGFGSAASQVGSNDLTPYLSAFSSHQTWLVNFRNKELAVTLGLEKIQLDAGVQAIQTVLGGVGGAAGAVSAGASAPGAALGALLPSVSSLATAQISASNTITMLDISTDGSFDIGAYQLGLSGEASVASFDSWFQSLSAASGHGVPHHLASAWRSIIGQTFQAIVALPSIERVHALLAEWGRYGYMIGQAFVPPRLDPMTHWSYWRTSETTILGSLPQSARDRVASAFERGVTVWNQVGEIGTTPDNVPRPGISY